MMVALRPSKNKRVGKHSNGAATKKRKRRSLQAEPDDLQYIDWTEHDAFMSERNARLLRNVSWPALSTAGTNGRSIGQAKPARQTFRPPPPGLDLTGHEWQLVRQAYANGLEREEVERWIANEAPKARRDLKRFLRFWDGLSQMAKNDLAEPGEDADFYEAKATEYRIVLRARERLKFWKPSRGRPQHFGYVEAANVLAQVCRSRGIEVRPGRLHSDKKPTKGRSSLYEPNAFVAFVSRALRHLDPAIKSESRAQRVAKSAVDNLHQQGLL